MMFLWVVSLLFTFVSSSPPCRCLYGDPCWPNETEFSKLQSNLSQPLIHPVPPESACYPSFNSAGNCTDVQLNAMTSVVWRTEQPGSMVSPNFETSIFTNGTIDACYFNTSLGVPCGQGSVPPIGVDARNAEDIQAAVVFAAKHNLRLVIKNTGHDLLGRSTARGGFMIWTHHLKNITYNPSFVPEGLPETETYNALTLQAGVQWFEAYDAAEANGRIIVGGTCPSVGAAGGWVSGGGHSMLASRHGLGVDNVIQFTIVIASGAHLTVNSHSYPELFWALRGGGGGTYGVLTSVTYRTHDPTPISSAFIQTKFSSPSEAKTVSAEYFRLWPSLSDAGWAGFSVFFNASFTGIFLAPNVSEADANATMNPFIDFVRGTANATNTDTFQFDSFYTWNQTIIFSSGHETLIEAVGNAALTSRLLPRDVFEDYEHLAETILSIEDSVTMVHVAGGAVSLADPESTGLNPAWRSANSLVIVGSGWLEGATVEEIRSVQARVKSWQDLLESIVPGGGSYLNEASLYEPDFQSTFFGDHYDQLERIKDLYDPEALFIVAEGVGSERWDAALNCMVH